LGVPARNAAYRAFLRWTGAGPDPIVRLARPWGVREFKSVLKRIFTWWNGATLGVLNIIAKRARFVGEDEFGNRYYEAKRVIDGDAGRVRRWVTYQGYAEASKVPPDWHGWLHHTFKAPPTVEPFKIKAWEKPHRPNLTGTPDAWRPQGSILKSGERPSATGDYLPWRPD
jgi:NADH:ubiquinone oxidoreductase subunit